jgi:hypothetical protein
MYFYPFMLDPLHNEVVSTACQELTHVWINGIDRQIRLRMDAISGSCKTQLDNVQTLVESDGRTPQVVNFLSHIAPQSSQLTEIAVRSREIAADTQRQVVDLLERLARELPVQFARSEGSPSQAQPAAMREVAAVSRKKRTV